MPHLTPTQFRTILLSHGWFDLPPFKADLDRLTLEFPFHTPAGRGFIRISADHQRCHFTATGPSTTAQAVTARCLSLDSDIAPLHRLVAGTNCDWIAQHQFGRHLRGCTLFEDAFKIMLNISPDGGLEVHTCDSQLADPWPIDPRPACNRATCRRHTA